MFSYVFMKILERRPASYDRRMDRASGGRIRRIKSALAALVPTGAQVLELGCGTGELAALVLARGATVEGFDRSPSMVAVAQQRIESEGLASRLTVRQMGVDGMDGLDRARYDVVLASLVLSELSDDERRYALRHCRRVLRPDGQLLVADEVWPRGRIRRLLHGVARAPLALATYLVSSATTRPLEDLPAELHRAGFELRSEERSHGDAFALFCARPRAHGAHGDRP